MGTEIVHRERPLKVVRAILDNNVFGLVAMGRAGGIIAGQHRDIRKFLAEEKQSVLGDELEKLAEFGEVYSKQKLPEKRNLHKELELEKRAWEANEHICPID